MEFTDKRIFGIFLYLSDFRENVLVMDEERYTIRDYKESDYTKCERLVSDAWDFDQILNLRGWPTWPNACTP